MSEQSANVPGEGAGADPVDGLAVRSGLEAEVTGRPDAQPAGLTLNRLA